MSEPRAGDTLTIRKLKYRGDSLWMMWQWEDTIWHRADDFWIALEPVGARYWRDDKTSIGADYSIMYFYPDQPFYLSELYEGTPPHRSKGWYCNISLTPERTSDGYSFLDLDLDIWLYPDLHYEILDQDEFREHIALYHYPPDYVRVAEHALEHLCERIAQVEFPFRPNVTTLDAALEFLTARYGKPALMPTPIHDS